MSMFIKALLIVILVALFEPQATIFSKTSVGKSQVIAIMGQVTDEQHNPLSGYVVEAISMIDEVTYSVKTDNHGFNITNTTENANVTAASDGVHWLRTQNWTFGTLPPWNTNLSNITLDTRRSNPITWDCMGEGPHLPDRCDPTPGWDGNGVGFPWNGTENHWRNGNLVEHNTDVFTWDAPNDTWACVDHRKYGGWDGTSGTYNCDTGAYTYPTDWFDEWIDYSANPTPHGVGRTTGSNYTCLSI